MMKPKVILITNIPNQYRVPLFNELNKQLNSKGKELLVVFGAKNYRARKSLVDLSCCKAQYQILTPSIFKRLEYVSGFFFYVGLIRLLIKERPESVIVSGFSIPSFKVVFLNFFQKFKVIIWSGTFPKNGTALQPLKLILRKFLVAKADHLIAYGSKAKQYYIDLGANKEKVSNVGNTVDVGFFSSISRRVNTENKLNGIYHLTYIGYLTPRKNVRNLLLAVKELLLIRTDFLLDIIGDGESKEDLLTLAEELNITDYIKFHGFKQKSDLPIYLSQSAVFLFPTDFDIWGLVLNEAMAAKVPCLASIHAAATTDLIKDGVTGFALDFSNAKKVAKKIDWMFNHPVELKKIGEQGSRFVNLNFSLAICAKKMISAI